MRLTNLKVAEQSVSFLQAVQIGLGKQQGLFFPESFPQLPVDSLLAMPFQQRSQRIMQALIGDELSDAVIGKLVEQAFTFAAPLQSVKNNVYCLELFHGPTLAFKDFGARFMAQAIQQAREHEKTTIVTATSGDTGAAVADAFYKQPGIQVVVLYPEGKVSALQEKQFSTLGDNILTLAVAGNFDQCQSLVKQVFDDQEVVSALYVNSANSINISRLLAQVCYYFEAVAQCPPDSREQIVFSVPSGNFGNLCAGLIAKTMGLPFKRIIAATNSNDTVPRYWNDGHWQGKPTQATLSNAMDISEPNNWPRIEAMLARGLVARNDIHAYSVTEAETQAALRTLDKLSYISEPHAAVAYSALERDLADNEVGIFLGTAHPAKFKQSVEEILGKTIELPEALAACQKKDSLSERIPADYQQLRKRLLRLR